MPNFQRIALLLVLLAVFGSQESLADDRKALVGGRLIDGLLGCPTATT
jgi:hypothetical protein